MLGPSNREVTVLSPSVGPCVIMVDFNIEIKSDSGSDSQTHSACTVGSSSPVVERNLNGRQTINN